MNDDFNTGGAVGTLFEMRKVINGFVSAQQLDGSSRAGEAERAELTAALSLLRELAGLLGVFRKPLQKELSSGDNRFSGALMHLLIDVRAHARQHKHFELADKIRDGLVGLNVTLEDRPDGTLWRRE